jgi:hypothetical protein
MTSTTAKRWVDGPFQLLVTPRHANDTVRSNLFIPFLLHFSLFSRDIG